MYRYKRDIGQQNEGQRRELHEKLYREIYGYFICDFTASGEIESESMSRHEHDACDWMVLSRDGEREEKAERNEGKGPVMVQVFCTNRREVLMYKISR